MAVLDATLLHRAVEVGFDGPHRSAISWLVKPRAASAASGTAAALLVACAQKVSAPPRSATATGSRANRVLPAPAGALITAPRDDGSDNSPASCSSSESRPTSGQAPRPVDGAGVSGDDMVARV